ncbi:MAG: hypothetical protein K6T26_05970 [Alicyclobacillus sp.]|nr:hypothetical protein [Alicyclobacillus sp.]
MLRGLAGKEVEGMRVLTNEMVQQLLTMDECIRVLEEAFADLAMGQAVERPRSHTYTPLGEGHHYLFKSMDGGLKRYRVHAIRMTSDHIHEVYRQGAWRREKVPAAPGGQWVGLILLFSMDSLEPLAIIQDGYLQRMRVGATSAIAARYLVSDKTKEAALIGTGWQAGAQILGLAVTCPFLERVYVYSPNEAHRLQFCQEFASQVPFSLIAVE